MVTHRRKKQVRKVMKNFRKFVTWLKGAKNKAKDKWQTFNKWGGNLGKTQCHECSQWVHQDWIADHVHLHEEQAKQKATRQKRQQPAQPVAISEWGPWKKVPGSKKSSVPVNPPQKKTPTTNPQQKQNGSKNGATVPTANGTQKPGGKQVATAGGSDEGTDTPWAGHEEVVAFFNKWAQAYPSNFEVNHQDAELMGEMWHGIADAFHKKCELLVSENHFPPAIVEPYEMCAQLAANMADHHKDMADRTQSTFGTLIEAMQGPVPRDTNFAKPR